MGKITFSVGIVKLYSGKVKFLVSTVAGEHIRGTFAHILWRR
jgi:hypothetical protein